MVQFVNNINEKYFTFNVFHYIARILLSFIFTFGLVGGVIGGLHPLVFVLYGLYALYIVHLKNDKRKWFLLGSLSIITFIMFWSFLYENNVIMTPFNDAWQFILIFISFALNVCYVIYHFVNFGVISSKKTSTTTKKSKKKGR